MLIIYFVFFTNNIDILLCVSHMPKKWDVNIRNKMILVLFRLAIVKNSSTRANILYSFFKIVDVLFSSSILEYECISSISSQNTNDYI